MARRLLTALVLATLAAGSWWIARGGGNAGDTGSGIRVLVEVVDLDGEPLPEAQVERVFENRRLRVSPEGTAALTDVVLRELDVPSPEALTRAVRVHTPFHALGPDRKPEVTQRDDGAWRMRFELRPHGILRLYVGETHLGPCKAFPEKPWHDRWVVEPIGGRDVARHGQPASYRVFDYLSEEGNEILVRIEGEPDRDGGIGVATRKVRVAIPAPGHVVEQVLEPEQVQVILGQVRVGDGPEPPSLGGKVEITELTEDGTRIPLARVQVPRDGRFIARRTGKGRYELEFDLDFFPGTTTLTVLGGASFDVTPAQPALWLSVEHPGLDLTKRVARVRANPAGLSETLATEILGGDGVSHVGLTKSGAWRGRLEVEGTNALPPKLISFTAEAGDAGAAQVISTRVEDAPYGRLVVEASEAAFGKARGASVSLERSWANATKRTATLIPGLAERAVFEHLTVGSYELSVDWDEPGREASGFGLDVKAGETSTWKLEAKAP